MNIESDDPLLMKAALLRDVTDRSVGIPTALSPSASFGGGPNVNSRSTVTKGR
jgi:hypothetical protein